MGAANDEDNLHGSPELVVGVWPPSMTNAEIDEKAVLSTPGSLRNVAATMSRLRSLWA
jgi:hypothetical protein